MVALKLKEKPSKKILGDKMATIVEAAKIIIKTGSIISRVISVRGGYRRKFVTYYLRLNPSMHLSSTYCVEMGPDYIDYIECKDGEFVPTRRGGSWYIRFPLSYEGSVLIIPTDYGFRVYLLK